VLGLEPSTLHFKADKLDLRREIGKARRSSR